MQVAEAKNTLAICGRLHDKSKVYSNALIAFGSLAGRRGRLVGFVKLVLRQIEQLSISGAIGKLGTPTSVLVHVTDTVRKHVSETMVGEGSYG